MKYQIQENCLTIFLPKEVDHCVAEETRLVADRLIKTNHIRYVLFDFAKTAIMDSSGIGVMLGRQKLVEVLGGEVWAVHTSPRIKKIIQLSGATRFIHIDEEDQADEVQ